MQAAYTDLRPTYSRDATDEGAPAPPGALNLLLGETFSLQLRPQPPPPPPSLAAASVLGAPQGAFRLHVAVLRLDFLQALPTARLTPRF